MRRQANRRLRAALLQIADNLTTNNHYFQARAARWRTAGKDPRWIRVKVAKIFSRLAFVMLIGPRLFPQPNSGRSSPRSRLESRDMRFMRPEARFLVQLQ